MVDVASFGEPMVEFCATEVGKLKDVQLFKRGWGGDTSNFIIAVVRLGGRAGYICRIGDDEFGESFLELWHREGVDTSQVIVEKGGFTAVYFISLLPGGGHDFTYFRRGFSCKPLLAVRSKPGVFKQFKGIPLKRDLDGYKRKL